MNTIRKNDTTVAKRYEMDSKSISIEHNIKVISEPNIYLNLEDESNTTEQESFSLIQDNDVSNINTNVQNLSD